MKICACIVVYKEQDTIAEMIESISEIVDELILVYDGENPDRTIEIAEEIGPKNGLVVRSFLHPHTGDPEYLRPIAYAKADCDWILAIDGDERLCGDIASLKRFLNNSPDISRIKLLWGTEKEISSAKMNRFKPVLFRPDRCYMIGVLTESVKVRSGESFSYRAPRKIESFPL